MIPYGRQSISDDDIQEVVKILRSEWLTQGPVIDKFEKAVADYCGVRYAVAVANGTAALHLASLAAGFGPGDEVITSPITFVATANSIIYSGATPVFADINPQTYCIDSECIKLRHTKRTKGIIPVHFAGQPCDMASIHAIAAKHDLTVIEDAAHAIGAAYQINGKTFKIGSCAHSDMTIFSFHPVKHITTGEGGMITTNNLELYNKLQLLRSHGITKKSDSFHRNDGPWYYEQQALGFNYRITDFQCALGLSQLKKLAQFINRRREIVQTYNEAFKNIQGLVLPFVLKESTSSWHLYVLQFVEHDRRKIYDVLRKNGLGVNVHYIPVHRQPYYAENFGYKQGDFPCAEEYYRHAITLPLYPGMSDEDSRFVINQVLKTLAES